MAKRAVLAFAHHGVTVGGVRLHRDAIFGLCFAVVFARLWLMRLHSSLWLDETQTYFLSTGTWSDLSRRLITRPFLSSLYFGLMKGLHDLGLTSEAWMRLPSVLALLLTVFVVYRLTSRLAPKSTALTAALIFAAMPAVAGEATDARPYALGMLCVTSSMFFLLRWLGENKLRDGLSYSVLAALSVWLHLTYATIIPIQALFVVLLRRKNATVSRATLLGVFGTLALLLVPLSLHVRASMKIAHEISWTARPSVAQLLATFSFMPLVPALLLGLLAAKLFVTRVALRQRAALSAAAVEALPLLFAWALVPSTALFVVSRLTPAHLFVERYYLPGYAAAAILAAISLQLLVSVLVRAVVLACTLVVALVSAGGGIRPWQSSTDWRRTAAVLQSLHLEPTTPLLFNSGFVETNSLRYLEDRDSQALLAGPSLVYPLPGRIINFPADLRSDTEPYLMALSQKLDGIPQVVLLASGPGTASAWLRGRLTAQGLRATAVDVPPPFVATLFQR